MNSSNRFDVL